MGTATATETAAPVTHLAAGRVDPSTRPELEDRAMALVSSLTGSPAAAAFAAKTRGLVATAIGLCSSAKGLSGAEAWWHWDLARSSAIDAISELRVASHRGVDVTAASEVLWDLAGIYVENRRVYADSAPTF